MPCAEADAPGVPALPHPALFLYCRAGFESECAAEIQDQAAHHGVSGFCRARPSSGYVLFHPHHADEAGRLLRELSFERLIFARQWFVAQRGRNEMPVEDRVTPLVEALNGLPEPATELFLETPDTNEAKVLSRFLRSFRRPFEAALERHGSLQPPDAGTRIHACFLNARAALVGYAYPANSAPWPMGIPRLHLARSAPSRAALKLEEAWLRFLSPQERTRYLRPGMAAVDLGAAPGGWTWSLTRKHLRVAAVDNGPLDEALLDSGLVEHLRQDAFRYRAPKPVDWLVADIADKPMRVMQLMGRWITEGMCRHVVFNLKLPMKRRYQELERCLMLLTESLERADVGYHLACKHLYHDREEVTAYVRRED